MKLAVAIFGLEGQDGIGFVLGEMHSDEGHWVSVGAGVSSAGAHFFIDSCCRAFSAFESLGLGFVRALSLGIFVRYFTLLEVPL